MNNKVFNHGIVILGITTLAFLAIASASVPSTINDGYKVKDSSHYEKAVVEQTDQINKTNHPINYNNRGIAYYYLGKYDWAIEDFEAALRLDPNSPARGNLVYARRAQGRVEVQDTPNPVQVAPAPAQTTLPPPPVLAQNSEADFKAEVTKDGKGVVLVKYTGQVKDVVIPETIQGMPVRELGVELFWGNHNITSVVIPEGITSIPHGRSGNNNIGTFAGCTYLRSVIFPKSLITIGAYAFSSCRNLTSITLPENLVNIGDYAFLGIGLRSIDIPKSVKYIGEGAFRASDLTSITWPDNVPIPEMIFWACKSLQTVVIPEGINNIKSRSFYSCDALTSITLPSTIREIGEQAFYNCSSLTTITIPDTVTKVSFSNSVFNGCSKLTLATQAVLRKLGYTGGF